MVTYDASITNEVSISGMGKINHSKTNDLFSIFKFEDISVLFLSSGCVLLFRGDRFIGWCMCVLYNVMLFVANTLLLMAIVWHSAGTSVAFRNNYTRQPLLGYRCVLELPSNQTALSNTARAQCVWRCLSMDDCLVVSHDHRLNRCELSMQLCDRVARNVNFSTNFYGIERKLCPQWVPTFEYDTQTAAAFSQTPGGNAIIVVARTRSNNGLYPGKHQRFGTFRIIFPVDERSAVWGEQGEILLMNSACLWAWIPFTSKYAPPVGAFLAGHDVNKERLYVARAIFEGVYSIGYYKSSTSLGYFGIFGGVRTTGVMDILVILW